MVDPGTVTGVSVCDVAGALVPFGGGTAGVSVCGVDVGVEGSPFGGGCRNQIMPAYKQAPKHAFLLV